jgi:hypothetical protein
VVFLFVFFEVLLYLVPFIAVTATTPKAITLAEQFAKIIADSTSKAFVEKTNPAGFASLISTHFDLSAGILGWSCSGFVRKKSCSSCCFVVVRPF